MLLARNWVYVATVVLTGGVFLLDLLLPRGPAPAVGYCGAVVIAGETRRSRFLILLTAICSALTWVAFFRETGESPAWMSSLNRWMVMAVIWLTAGLSILRQRALAAAERQSAELARSNADLEQFASIAAHDLRAPLVSIDASIQMLEEHWHDRNDPQSAELLAFVRASTRRMTGLIRSLLSYARAGAERPVMDDCDMEEALEEAMGNLRSSISEAGAQVSHDPLPVVRGNCVQMRQVLQNLLENAVKYRGSSPVRVQITSARRGRDWWFSVTDNGPGIPAGDRQRIFELYERSEAGAEQPGAGIGLATCRRIVERHGGRIWIEPAPGGGSVFTFTLPVR